MPKKRGESGIRHSKGAGIENTSLSEDTIVDAALEIIGQGGVTALTMQRLARRLEVGAMSLYYYFPSKSALMRAVERKARQVVFELLPTSNSLSWDALLVEHYTNLRKRVVEVPGLGALLLSSGRLVAAHDDTGSVLGLLNRHLTAMRSAGFSAEAAARGIEALSQYTLGFSLREFSRAQTGEESEQLQSWRTALADIRDDGPLRSLGEAAPYLITSGSAHQFHFGLQLIIDGLRSELCRIESSHVLAGPKGDSEDD
jgi:TetR/AcrR family transcriptional regulator, tetracycline repressor protein